MVRSVYLGCSESNRTAIELDYRLAALLAEDGRMSGRDLARKLGISEATVSRRLALLESERLMIVRGFVHPAAVGCAGVILARIAVDHTAPTVASALAREMGVHRIARLDGGQQISALVVGVTADHAIERLDRAMDPFPQARIEDLCSVLHILPSRCTLAEATLPEARVPRQATIQNGLLHAIRGNMRRSLNEVSAEIGASPSATRANLERLLQSGVIRPVVHANPYFMGTPVMAQFCVRPRRGIGAAVAKARATLPDAWIFECLSPASVLVASAFATANAVEQAAQALRDGLDGADVTAHLLLEVHSCLLDWCKVTPAAGPA